LRQQSKTQLGVRAVPQHYLLGETTWQHGMIKNVYIVRLVSKFYLKIKIKNIVDKIVRKQPLYEKKINYLIVYGAGKN